ncbi:MAG TPA: CHAT domain-containing tetratricopeptide repeat protein [Rhizobiaceae bacterium]|nr:CHAT domain-containing tetratricopeptide repeat protein [Rhizobiaceae bacterium]
MSNAFASLARRLATGLLAAQFVLIAAPYAHAQQEDAPAQPAVELTPAEAAFEKRIREAYAAMGVEGKFEEAYKQLRATLIELARTDLFAFTVRKYTEAGQLFHQNGLGEESEAVFSEGEQIRAMNEDVKERPDFYLAYANFKVAARDFNRIVPLFTTATNLYAQYYGTESREVMNANDLMAVALGDIGQFGTSANLMLANYELALKSFGPDEALVWRLANNLADTLRNIGAPGQALEYDRMVLEKRTAYYGRDHFNVLVSANNTAQDYLDLGDYAAALSHFELNRQIAIALRERDPGLEPQADAWILYTRLAAGEQPFDDKTIATMEALVLDADYPAMLSYKAARLLADHFKQAGDAARGMKQLENALSIASAEMSPTHPYAFETRRVIANAKGATDAAFAAKEYANLDTEMIRWIAMQVMFAGNRDFAEATRALADDMLYDYALFAEKDVASVPAFADAARRWPSLEDGRRDTLRKLMRLVDPKDEDMKARLRELLHMSLMNQEIFSAGTDDALGHTNLDAMKGKEDQINTLIAERYKFGQADLDVPLPLASKLLDDNEALVSYFITRKWRADRQSAEPFDDVRLYAIVWRKDAEPKLRYLGDPREIVAHKPTVQVAALPKAETAARGAVPIGQMDAVFGGLYGTLIAPLDADLLGADTLFVIPDGQLFAVPFSLLADDKGRSLEERFSIRLLTRPEALYNIRSEQKLAAGGRAILAGGLDYANGAEKGADPLPGTLKEVDTIAALLRAKSLASDLLTGDSATEPVLREAMERATVAHLATHGSYGSPKNGGASNVDTLWQSDVILSKSGDKRSMTRDDKDGRLYAYELMTWDLSKLDLLVLSACDTGRGDETFVGGLRGLPTAINIAGARRSLLTLWPVADEGTANFMTRFYEHLAAGMTYAEALRQTRRDAIGGTVAGAGSPQVWAAFVMFEN